MEGNKVPCLLYSLSCPALFTMQDAFMKISGNKEQNPKEDNGG